MNSLINERIRGDQFFNIKDNELIIGNSKEIGILELTSFVAKSVFDKFNEIKPNEMQYDALQHNLKFIKTRIDKHNNAWPVKCAYWLGLNILINELGLDKYNFFAKLKTCDTHIIDSFIDEQVIKNLRAEGFDQKMITKILDFIRRPEHDSFSLHNLSLNKIPIIIFIHPAFSRLKTLDLSKNKLTTLPPEIGNMINLRELNLNNNRLTTLPAEVGNLIDLRELNLHGNQLTALPAEIGNLIMLSKLQLSYNRITALPAQIGNLINLLELNLITNELTTLPVKIGNLNMLSKLQLSSNRITDLPAEIENLTNLLELSLYRNQLTTLPTEIGKLTNLRELYLAGNQLTALPTEIGNLTNLKQLNLYENQLTALPTEIGKLTMLSELDLFGNALTTLPTEIGNLNMLSKLELSSNRITDLPAEIDNLTNLRELNLYGNRLTTLSVEICRLTGLQQLNLSGNQLTALPTEIGNLANLQQLNLTNNRSLTGLPAEILRLPQRCTVNLTGCDLSETVLSNLRQATGQLGYGGPAFSYSMEARGVVDERSAEGLLKELFQKVNQAYEPTLLKRVSGNPNNVKSLRTWLSRLSSMKDYQSGQPWLPAKILSFLNLAIEDKNFSDKFYVIINGAADTCGDRMALSVINLGVAYQLTKSMEIKALAEFLKRGVWDDGPFRAMCSSKSAYT